MVHLANQIYVPFHLAQHDHTSNYKAAVNSDTHDQKTEHNFFDLTINVADVSNSLDHDNHTNHDHDHEPHPESDHIAALVSAVLTTQAQLELDNNVEFNSIVHSERISTVSILLNNRGPPNFSA